MPMTDTRKPARTSKDHDSIHWDLDTTCEDSGTQSAATRAFFKKVEEIKQDMTAIRSNIDEIEKQHDAVLKATSKSASSKAEASMQGLMISTSALLMGIKTKLTQMKEDEKANMGDSEARMRISLQSTLTRRVLDLSEQYQAVQRKFRDKYRDRLGRELRIVKPNATMEDVDALMKAGGDKDVFAQTLMQQRSDQAAKNALADIQDRHRDVMRLQQVCVSER
mmetsp:Transcript_75753/g.202803  ORF Transcript_75753/g.202803 Transcript_75753/m.202803 type:complete len:222 (+) Transcript_75753:154-819(+)